ncbi:MAG: hypothetical protein K8R13_02915 [Methanococcoides sp.]|nr:hypothetical protein [Methanococcoides sp.]
MKNTYIPLLVLLVLAVITAGATIMNADADEKILIDNGELESENLPAVDGGNNDKLQPLNTIANIIGIETWDSTTVLLLDQDESDIGEGYPCDIYLKIGQETTIKDSNGNELTIEDLDNGTRIEAYYGPATTRSLPAQSVAISIVVLDEDEKPGILQPVKTLGTIIGTEKWTSSTMVLLDEDEVEIGEGYPCDIYLSIGDQTTIEDENGNKLSVEDLTKGTRVEAYYGPMVTASLPPQSGAVSIVVLSE